MPNSIGPSGDGRATKKWDEGRDCNAVIKFWKISLYKCARKNYYGTMLVSISRKYEQKLKAAW